VNVSGQKDLLFTWHEALAEDIKALGGRKKVAPRLWPGIDEETAIERIKACLAPGHNQQLKPMEVLAIKQWAREVGSSALVEFEAQYLSYRVEWVSPANELEQIERENNELLKELLRRQERADKLRSLRSVK
jgi:hypothetical protein